MSSYFHSASQSCPILSANCRYNLRLFRLFRGDSSGMDKSSSAKCLLYSDVVKGEPNPTGRGRRSRDDQSRSWRYSFHKYFQLFSIYFFFSITLLYHFLLYFFTHDIYPHPHPHPHPRPTPTTHDPRPTTSTPDPRPTTFSYTPFHFSFLLFPRNASYSGYNRRQNC